MEFRPAGAAMRSSTRERRDKILSELYEQQHVTASGLAALLSVSQATIRRDLHALAEAGQIELLYGGATLPRNSDFSFRAKAVRNVEAKRAIGRLAAGLVGNGDQIFLDSGTTCFEMTRYLKRKRGVSVITNSARLALELESPSLNVIMLGGRYRPDRMDTVGPLAMDSLGQLRGYVAFIGADGVSMDFGLAASDDESAYLHRLAVANASKAVLLVDHSKFVTQSLCRIVDWESISRVVTDRLPGSDWAEFLGGHDIEVMCPSPFDGGDEDGTAKPS